MTRPWQNAIAETAAVRLHRWASTLMTILIIGLALAVVGGIALTAAGVADSNGDWVTAGVGIALGSFISSLPTIVFGLWAQAYAADLRARMAEPVVDEDEPVARRRPRTGQRL